MSQTDLGTSERDQSIGGLIGGLASDVQALVRGELALARAEADEKLQRVLSAAIWIVGGALVGFAGLVVLLQALAVLLAGIMPAWLATLLVGVVIIVVGGLVARSGIAMLSLKALTPTKTAESLRKDAHLLKEHTP